MIDATTIGDMFKRCTSDNHIHGYHNYYESVLNDDVSSILEIGVKEGASLAAWRRLLPHARVAG